jgi:ApbE superfamily uncharacterized protein (UPF0280 family)
LEYLLQGLVLFNQLFKRANTLYQERKYRNLVDTEKLKTFQVVVQETDLLVHAEKRLVAETRELVLEHRGYVEAYIKAYPGFMSTLDPWRRAGPTPNIISDMIKAGAKAGVGPMAAIAGAIAEIVGRGLLDFTDQVIVENGGDVFIITNTPVTVGIFAGLSPLSMQVGLQLNCENKPTAVCTSSGTLGHSLSLGKADAVCVVADSCALADAAATSIGNLVQSEADIGTAIAAGQRIAQVAGIVIIAGEKIGAWGDLEMVPIITPP